MVATFGTRKWAMLRAWSARSAALALLACNSESGGFPYSPLGDEVEREGWVDTAHALAGDGATSFDVFRRSGQVGEYFSQPWEPFVAEQAGVDAGALTSVLGDHLLSLSRFRGLVSTRLTGPDAPQVEASVPFSGLPVGFVVSEGVAAVIVLDPQKPGCVLVDCARQTSRVVLIDVSEPANPRALGEQRFDGSVLAARQVGGVLHVLSQDIGPCSGSCEAIPRSDIRWLSFDRSVPGELPPPRVTPLGKDAFFADDRLLSLAQGPEFDQTELRVADLSEPVPALSAPLTLAGRVRQARASGDRLRVTYDTATLDIETFALEPGLPVSLGRGTLAAPEGEGFSWLTFDGDRAAAMLESSQRLALFDLSNPAEPRVASWLGLELAQSQLTLAGDRLLVLGHSPLPAPDPLDDGVARGPQLLVLVDIAELASPRVLDRATLGSSDSVLDGAPELRDGRAFLAYYDALPGAGTLGACVRERRRLVAYDIAAGTLTPALSLDAVDADARVEVVGDDLWLASSVSVSRYGTSGGAALARADLTRWVDRLQPLSGSLALFGVDFATNTPTFELSPTAAFDVAAPREVSTALGLSPVGCDERRRWFSPLAERDGYLYALRAQVDASDAEAAAATLHVVAAGTAAPSSAGSLELEPLAAGESLLGAVQIDRSLLVARGGGSVASGGPYPILSGDPTSTREEWDGRFVWDSDPGDVEQRDARASYDVFDLSEPSAPVLASRLDIDPALATGGFFASMRGLTRDSAMGFLVDGSLAGPSIISGAILAGSHFEPASSGHSRFYLDRFDLSDPRAPAALEPIEVPGTVLDFDAATGGLISLEYLLLREPRESPRCRGVVLLQGQDPRFCRAQHRALSGLVVDGARATRVGRLLVDTDEREALRFAVSNGVVYYVTQPSGLSSEQLGPYGARDISLQRVALRDGRFERWPSFDIAASSNLSPKLWTQFVARGDRALWVNAGQLMVADFRSGEPRLEVHDLGLRGCTALALREDTVYCAQGKAGYVTLTLGEP